MDLVLKAFFVYLFLFVLFRLTGKRSLGQLTPFDFLLLLIIGESVQQGLVGRDNSMTGAFVIVTTLVFLDVGISFIKDRLKSSGDLLEGVPLVVLVNGRLLKDRMRKERIDEEDILAAARRQGLEKLDDIKVALLERDGHISIIANSRKSHL